MPEVKVVDLRAEYREVPLGLGETAPRLSWRLEAEGRNVAQSGYQIQVASSPEALRADAPDLWDSGRIDSSESIQVAYAGAPLTSRARCWWRVRIWDEAGVENPWSEEGRWTMGLLEAADWQAEWIGFDEPLPPEVKGIIPMTMEGSSWIGPEAASKEESPNTYVFRKRIETTGDRKVREARIALAAGDQFRLYANGVLVGESDGRFWAWVRPAQIDITEALQSGSCTLAAETVHCHAPAPGLVGKIVIAYEDGAEETLVTDASWAVAHAPAGEWRQADFDDSPWAQAKVVAAAGEGPWGPLCQAPIEIPPCPQMRKEFQVAGEVVRATAYVTALGLYELHLNGCRADEALFAPGWTDYAKRLPYQELDLTGLIQQGSNAIGVVLGHGWYSGYLGWQVHKRGIYGQDPRLLLQIEIDYADGRVERVCSDASWRAAHGPVIGADFYMGEQYDARREMPGWDQAGFDDGAWQPVAVCRPKVGALVATCGVPVRRMQEITPVAMTSPEPGRFIFDLGQNIVGWTRIRVKGEAGAKVTLRFVEMLQPDGSLYLENLRSARSIDEYWLRGGEAETWEPRFTFHGFRHVEVQGEIEPPALSDIVGVVVYSDTPLTGRFECSNPDINQLQQNIQWGQRGNFLEVPTDCPQRDERLGWMGDAQVFARTACFNMDTAAFFTKWMWDVVDAQSPEGAFSNVSPRAVSMGDSAAAWADAGVIVPWTIYQCYGDVRMLEAHYEAMCRWIDSLDALNPNHLWLNRRGDDFGDWLSIESQTPKEVIATAYFAHGTRLLSEIAGILGRAEDEGRYARLAEAIRAAFVEAYVDEEGLLLGDTQTGYLLALEFGLVEGALRTRATEHLTARIEERGHRLSTGFVGCPLALFGLSNNDRLDLAYRLLQHDVFPSWLYPIRHGATTIWERWDGWTHDKGFQNPGMNSFNHYAYGAVGDWLYRVVAGIDCLEPGYREVLIRPRPGGGMTHATGEYRSMQGLIRSAWRIENDRFILEVTLPPNTRGRVYIPSGDTGTIEESGAPATGAAGVLKISAEEGRTRIEIGSGAYCFSAPYQA